MKTKGKIASQVKHQFPLIYQEEAEFFVSFVKTYYDWMESAGKALYHSRRIPDYIDVDTTPDEFLARYKEKYLPGFAMLNETDKRTLVKHSLDIYRSKGSVRAIKLLFKLVYDDNAEVYWPGDDLFKPSDAVYHIPKYLELAPSTKAETFIGKQIQGSLSGATAIVESVSRRTIGAVTIDVAQLSSVRGTFQYGEIVTTDGIIADAPRVIGSMTTLSITSRGRNFTVGEVVDVVSSQSGYGGKARIVKTQDQSGQVAYNIVDGGSGYSITPRIYVSERVLGIEGTRYQPTVSTPTGFAQLEEVRQPLSNGVFFSATSNFTLGSYVFGANSSGANVAGGAVVKLNQVPGESTGTFVISDHIFDTLTLDTVTNGDTVTGTFAVGSKVYQQAFGTNTSIGVVIGANTTAVLVDRQFGNFTTNTIVYAKDLATTANVASISTIDGKFSNSSLGVSDVLSANTDNALGGSGATAALITSFTDVTANATMIGGNSAYIGLYGISTNYPFVSHPQAHVIGMSSNTYANATYLSSGNPGSFDIGSILDSEVAIINTDFIISNTVGNIRFLDLPIDTTGNNTSNVGGILTGVSIVDGGSGGVTSGYYTVVGGNGMVVAANVSITASAGIIVDAAIVTGGEGYTDQTFQETLTTLGNGDAVLEFTNKFGYGFSKNVYASSNSLITATLSYTNVEIGTIGSLVNINPGTQNTIDPVVLIVEPAVAGAEYHDLALNFNTPNTYNFVVGETVTQVYDSPLSNVAFNSFSGNTTFSIGEGIRQVRSDGKWIYGRVLSQSLATPPYKLVIGDVYGMVSEVGIGITNPQFDTSNTLTSLTSGITLTPTSTSTASFQVSTSAVVLEATDTHINVRRLHFDNRFKAGVNVSGVVSSATALIGSADVIANSQIMGNNAIIFAEAGNAKGTVIEAAVLDSGAAYQQDESVYLQGNSNPYVATAIVTLQKEGTGSGGWNTTDSFPSSEKKIQDSNYYQEYSYEIQSALSKNVYEKKIKDLVHVAGTRMFGAVRREATANSQINVPDTLHNEYQLYVDGQAGNFNTTDIAVIDPAGANIAVDVTDISLQHVINFNANTDVVGGDSTSFCTSNVNPGAAHTFNAQTDVIEGYESSFAMVNVSDGYSTSFDGYSNVVSSVDIIVNSNTDVITGTMSSFNPNEVTTGTRQYVNANTSVTPGAILSFNANADVGVTITSTFNAQTAVTNGSITITGANSTPSITFNANVDVSSVTNSINVKTYPLTTGTWIEYRENNIGNANAARFPVTGLADSTRYVVQASNTTHIALANVVNLVVSSNAGISIGSFVYQKANDLLEPTTSKFVVRTTDAAQQVSIPASNVRAYGYVTRIYKNIVTVQRHSPWANIAVPYVTMTDTVGFLGFDNTANLVFFDPSNLATGNTSVSSVQYPAFVKLEGTVSISNGVTLSQYANSKQTAATGSFTLLYTDNSAPSNTLLVIDASAPGGSDMTLYKTVLTSNSTVSRAYGANLVINTTSNAAITIIDTGRISVAPTSVSANTTSNYFVPLTGPWVRNGASNNAAYFTVTSANTYFAVGDRVRYTNSGGVALNGLRTDVDYFIQASNTTTIRLANTSGGSPIVVRGDAPAATGTHSLFNYNGKTSVIAIASANTSLLPGDPVKYVSPAGKGSIGGLASDGTYYVQFSNTSVVALSGSNVVILAVESNNGIVVGNKVYQRNQAPWSNSNTAVGTVFSVDGNVVQVSISGLEGKFTTAANLIINATSSVALSAVRDGQANRINITSSANSETHTIVDLSNGGIIAFSSANTFRVNDPVTYITARGNTALSGLSNNGSYFIESSNNTHLTLSTTPGGSRIYLPAKGTTESGHYLVGRSTLVFANAYLFTVGDQVQYYTENGNTAIGGLANASSYYVIAANASAISLATQLTTGFSNASVVIDANNAITGGSGGGANSTIAITNANNVFDVNDTVVYTVSAGNTAIANLVSGETYYISTANSTAISLSALPGGNRIIIDKGVTETGHTLTNIARGGVIFTRGLSESGHFLSHTGIKSTIASKEAGKYNVGDKVAYMVSAGNTVVGGLIANGVSLTVGSTTGFAVGSPVWQSNGISNTAVGTVAAVGTDVLILSGSSVSGKFVLTQNVIANATTNTTLLAVDKGAVYTVQAANSSHLALHLGGTLPRVTLTKGVSEIGHTLNHVGNKSLIKSTDASALTVDDKVKYTSAYGAIAGLTLNTTYYVQFANSTHFALAANTSGTRLPVVKSFVDQPGQTFSRLDTGYIELTNANTHFTVGDAVQYTVDYGNTALNGLTNNNVYYIETVNSTALSLSYVVNGNRIPVKTLSSGSETGHNLVAVDNRGLITIPGASQFAVGDAVEYHIDSTINTVPVVNLTPNETYFIQYANSSTVALSDVKGGSRIPIRATTPGSDDVHYLTSTGLSGAIIAPKNDFKEGDKVVYTVAAGNTALPGLVNGGEYYIQVANNTLFTLTSNVELHFSVSNYSTVIGISNLVPGSKIYQRTNIANPSEVTATAKVLNIIDPIGGDLGIDPDSIVGTFKVNEPFYCFDDIQPMAVDFVLDDYFYRSHRLPLKKGKLERGHNFSTVGLPGTIQANGSTFVVGERVLYVTANTADPAPVPVSGLVNNSTYFIQFANDTHIALSSTDGGSRIAVGRGADIDPNVVGHFIIQAGDYNYILTSAGANLTQGDAVMYNSNGGTNIGGLVSNNMYYIQFANTTAVALANTPNGPRNVLTAVSGSHVHSLSDNGLNMITVVPVTSISNNAIVAGLTIEQGTTTANIDSVDLSI